MILDFIFYLANSIINLITAILPEYDSLPFPEWFLTNATTIFEKIRVVVELPIIRVFFDLFTGWFLVLWLVLFAIVTIIKYASVIPGLGGLVNLKD